MSAAAGDVAGLGRVVDGVLRDGVAYLRGVDEDAAARVRARWEQELGEVSVAVVGETGRGKSCLVNALLGVEVSPAGVGVATSTFVVVRHAPQPQVRVRRRDGDVVAVGVGEVAAWVAGDASAGAAWVEVGWPVPLLGGLRLVDTPGAGSLDALRVQVAVEAAAAASVLVFVADASAPLSRAELDFLTAVSGRVEVVLFALAKTDVFAGWRTVLADNQALLRVHAPRFADAPWFAVSARLAGLAAGAAGEHVQTLLAASGVAPLRHALVGLGRRGAVLGRANAVRALRSELVGVDARLGAAVAATRPDALMVEQARSRRAELVARSRGESRQWSLMLGTLTQRARVEVGGVLREGVVQAQQELSRRVDAASAAQLRVLPQEVDAVLQALAVRVSQELSRQVAWVGEQVLAQVFDPAEVQAVVGQVSARVGEQLGSRAVVEPAGGRDSTVLVLSSVGAAVMAGRGAAVGASALGLGAAVGAGVVVPVVGVGLGLAAGAWLVWRRRVAGDRQQARVWLREVLSQARAQLGDDVAQRFTQVQYALTVAVDEAVARRLQQWDAHIAEVDRMVREDEQVRARRRAGLLREREQLRVRVRQVDAVLARLVAVGRADVGRG